MERGDWDIYDDLNLKQNIWFLWFAQKYFGVRKGQTYFILS